MTPHKANKDQEDLGTRWSIAPKNTIKQLEWREAIETLVARHGPVQEYKEEWENIKQESRKKGWKEARQV